MSTWFTVLGQPVAWQRARQQGKRFFTDPRVAAHKKRIGMAAMGPPILPVEGTRSILYGREVIQGPVSLTCRFYFEPAASWSKKKHEETTHHTIKPDIDNLVKLVSDALNGVMWVDDAQVFEVKASKHWDATARTEFSVEPWG
jgi:hypothetical protein